MPRLNRRAFTLGVAAAVVAAGFGGEGTLAADPAPNQALIDLFKMIPSNTIDVTKISGQIAAYADVAGQLKAVGVTAPVDTNAPAAQVKAWSIAVNALAAPSAMIQAFNPDWGKTFGFEVFDIDRSLEFGEPPLILTAHRGRFKPDRIGAALKLNGYKSIKRSDAVVWSLHEDETISVDNPANRLALARMNNIALIGNDTLLAAPRLDALEAMLDAIAGNQPSAAADKAIAALLNGIRNPLASCIIASGDSVVEKPGDIEMVFGGVTFGASVAPESTPSSSNRNYPDAVKWDLAVLMKSETSAKTLFDSLDSNLKTGKSLATKQPYTDFFSDWKIDLLSSTSIVTVEFTFVPGRSAGIWVRFFYQRDLGFLELN